MSLPAADDWPALVAVVRTEDGLTGIGEVGIGAGERAAAGLIEDLRPLLVGVDATRIDHIWQLGYRSVFFPSDRHPDRCWPGSTSPCGTCTASASAYRFMRCSAAARGTRACLCAVRGGSMDDVLNHAAELAELGWQHLRLTAWDPAEPEYDARGRCGGRSS